MHAVIRETMFTADFRLEETPQFGEFQAAHAGQPGYRGTVVTTMGQGRYVTVTLWDTAEHMACAREALQDVVDRLINPFLTAPSRLFGTGVVVYTDIQEHP